MGPERRYGVSVVGMDRFQLVEKIATGGMADVHVALQRGGSSFVRTVVIKRLHSHLAEQPQPCAAFESEGRLLALLDHPAIPFVVDYGMDQDCPYLAMQHFPGPTLQALLDANRNATRPTPVDVCISIGLALADALDHAHERRDVHGRPVDIVHLDLTPSNVVLRPSGRPGLIDFGIATTARDRRSSPVAGVRGTPGYMSPEQFTRRHSIDRRADVFLLGTLLWELLVGEPLFPRADLAFFEAITQGLIPNLRDSAPSMPVELEAIVMRALAQAPTDRYANMRQFGDALGAFATRCGVATGAATICEHVQSVFPVDQAPSYLPDDEHGAAEIPELTLLDDDGGALADDQASLSERERRELLDDLDLFAVHSDDAGESSPDDPRAGTSETGPPPVPPHVRGGLGPSVNDDSGVYMQIEPVVDQVFRDD